MAIESARLAVKGTVEKEGGIPLFVGSQSSVKPGNPREFNPTQASGTGTTSSVDTQLPTAEGELFVYRPDFSNQFAQLYVAVDIGGTLEWKLARPMGSAIDARTGERWDPNAGFYNPLAT
jgi:hypothetical protein